MESLGDCTVLYRYVNCEMKLLTFIYRHKYEDRGKNVLAIWGKVIRYQKNE
jgi:hypothetical protein